MLKNGKIVFLYNKYHDIGMSSNISLLHTTLTFSDLWQHRDGCKESRIFGHGD